MEAKPIPQRLLWRFNEHVVLSNMPNTEQVVNFFLLSFNINNKKLLLKYQNQETVNLFDALVSIHKQYWPQLCLKKKILHKKTEGSLTVTNN